MSELVDQFQRKFEYLRMSVTDVCNFKCTYCLPDGYHREHKGQFLRLDEITQLAKGFAQLGTKKIRITVGTVMGHILVLCHNLVHAPIGSNWVSGSS